MVKNLQKHDNGESFFFATMLRTFEVCRLFFWLIWGYLLSKFLIKIYHFWLLRVTLFQLISSNNVSQYGVFYINNVIFLSKIQITVNSVTKCKNEKTFTTNDLYKISCKSKIYLINFLLHKNIYILRITNVNIITKIFDVCALSLSDLTLHILTIIVLFRLC